MGKKQITFCDGCDKELKSSENYHIDFNTSKFTDAAGSSDYNFLQVDLCWKCAKSVVHSMQIIKDKQ